ncbi:MAG: ATP-binding cassette domain-containing protein [Methylophilaceae bacterium]|nr:MAG: ATP-binding cassette domain-containing protein [Methylophilaceae bacterium]
MKMPVITIRNLSHRLEKAGVGFTLRVPRLEILSGETTAFVGESGSGKSTLLDLLGLITKPDSAEEFSVATPDNEKIDILHANEIVLACLRRKYFGYMLQTGALLPFLNVYENIALPRKINRLQEDGYISELLETLNIAGQKFKKPSYLSGGQRQRVALARALSHRPTTILADEPTGAVDKVTATEIRDLLLDCARMCNAVVLIVTHDEGLIQNRTDRLFCFDVAKNATNETEAILREDTWAAHMAG